mmetsp:Transcript_1921/g.5619  ORF Transcript_1921/g.5619 Transcript_1921/m.5619 type:complete len:1277 (-) Transcript_1921:1740-5570(-)
MGCCASVVLMVSPQSHIVDGSSGTDSVPAGRGPPTEALEAAARLLPFMPKRVEAAFLEGGLDPLSPTLDGISSPPPVALEAAVLLVDVSGFTKLSEHYSQMGTEGCEQFSTMVSKFLALLCNIVQTHSGDIDCFAGDSLLIVFTSDSPGSSLPQVEGTPAVQVRSAHLQPYSSGDTASTSSPGEQLGASLGKAVDRAVHCLNAICDYLNGYRFSNDSPPLMIHAALSAGRIYAVISAATRISRSEAFIMGQPLSDLRAAIPDAGLSELAIAPSAWQRMNQALLTGSRDTGTNLVLRLQQISRQTTLIASRSEQRVSIEGDTSSSLMPRLPTSPTRSVAEVVQRARQIQGATSCSLLATPKNTVWQFPSLWRQYSSKVAPQSLALGDSGNLDFSMSTSGGRSKMSGEHASSTNRFLMSFALKNTYGLDALLSFIPTFVGKRCLLGTEMEMLAENRSVSILFLVAELEDKPMGLEYVQQVQIVLGRLIEDVVLATGGSVRQVTVDDKGLAAIFVFGLPGFLHGQQQLRCVEAALLGMVILEEGGVRASAGMDCGPCYCGLVGDDSQRCEYAVMGDAVNTAARLAWKAQNHANGILCSERLQSHLTSSKQPAWLHLQPAGTVQLKGKKNLVEVFVPLLNKCHQAKPVDYYDNTPNQLVGLDDAMVAVKHFVAGCCRDEIEGQDDCRPLPRVLIIKAASGGGKTSVLNCVRRDIIPATFPTGKAPVMVHCQVSPNDGPFSLCHQMLRSLLEAHGQSNAAQLCCLEGNKMEPMCEQGLPGFMQRFSSAILELHQSKEPSQSKAMGFQQMYIKVIRAALSISAMAITIDDLHFTDSLSKSVLISLSFSAAAKGRSFIIATAGIDFSFSSSQPGLPGVQQGGNVMSEFNMERDVVLITIGSLEVSEVAALAAQLMNCRSLQSDLASVITDHSQGIPIHVVEICQWLLDRSSLDIDSYGEARLRRKDESTELFMPPSIQAVIQAQIDNLEPILRLLLRIASALGSSFSLEAVVGLAELQGVPAAESMFHLRTLASLGILKNSHDCLWQFAHQAHQEVVYSAVLHQHKRSIHRKALAMLRQQIVDSVSGGHSPAGGGAEFMHLHAGIIHHWRCLVAGSSLERWEEHRISEDDLRSFFRSCAVTIKHTQLMHFDEQSKHIVQLMEDLIKCVQPKSFRVTNESWTQLQYDIVKYVINLDIDLRMLAGHLGVQGEKPEGDNMLAHLADNLTGIQEMLSSGTLQVAAPGLGRASVFRVRKVSAWIVLQFGRWMVTKTVPEAQLMNLMKL